MSLYSYRKKVNTPQKRILAFISYSSMTIGALFLFWSFYPVVASEVYSRIFVESDIHSPIPDTSTTSVELAESVRGSNNKFSTNLVDYTKASNWFQIQDYDIDAQTKARPDITEYTLDIPKLNIEGARVIVGGEDLLAGVIQYRPEVLPGQVGTVNIFGHSTLPQLYNPKNYKTIFSYVPTLVNGDVIYVTVDGVKYTYEVYDREVVKPDQISVLNQRYDTSYLQLITCVPLGTFALRHVAKAKLVNLPI